MEMKKVLAGWSKVCPGCNIGRKYPDSFIGKKVRDHWGKGCSSHDAYVADKSIAATLDGQIVLILDTSNDSRVQYPEEAKREGIASVLSVPITVKGQIIGVLRIYTSEQRNFSDDEYELISGLADMGGIAIDNARMYDHLKAEHEKLIDETHRWFEYGQA